MMTLMVVWGDVWKDGEGIPIIDLIIIIIPLPHTVGGGRIPRPWRTLLSGNYDSAREETK